MNQFLGRLDRVQRSARYKKIATVVVAVLAIALYVTMTVIATQPDAVLNVAAAEIAVNDGVVEAANQDRSFVEKFWEDHLQQYVDTVDGLYRSHVAQFLTGEGRIALAVVYAFFTALFIAIIWLGLSLTFLALQVGVSLITTPMLSYEATEDWGFVISGGVSLLLILVTLLRLASLALAGPMPLFAVARNVLAEAVRMKISLVFIVILLLLLAFIPTTLDSGSYLRFRVQQWLTYGLGLSYAVLALLTVFLSVATVTFEQRDKIIWQTMTKPVRPWEYLLGKWLGVMTLNLVLLLVSAGGVFLFTEYLRNKPADGESSYMVDIDGNPTLPGSDKLPSEDRQILEDQILAARVSVKPISWLLDDDSVRFYADLRIAQDDSLTVADRPRIEQELRDNQREVLLNLVNQRLEALKLQADYFEGEEEGLLTRRPKVTAQVINELTTASRSVMPGDIRTFYFDLRHVWDRWQPVFERNERLVDAEIQRMIDAGEIDENDARQVSEAQYRAILDLQKQKRIPPIPIMTVRYTIDSGSNDPTQTYNVRFAVNGEAWPQSPFMPRNTWGLRRVGLGHATSWDFPVLLLDRPGEDNDGILELTVQNDPGNPRTMTFGGGNLEIMYDAGGYQLNFLRTIAAMWMKLAFISAVGIMLSTSLSFPVAAMVTLAVLFAGEGADFLAESLDSYITKDAKGNISYERIPIRAIAIAVSWMFETYGSIKPAEGIADGRLMSWRSLAWTAVWIGSWSVGLLGLGWLLFRRRELAIYSGH